MLIVPIIALHHQSNNTLLLSVRQKGQDLAGFYEFPGGKTEIGELPAQALCREIYEELDIVIKPENLDPVMFTEFCYEEKSVLLLMYYCNIYSGTPKGNEGQAIYNVPLDKLDTYKMPLANQSLIPALKKYITNLK